MRKIKFMLLSLTLLAVVGGALAFKAKFFLQACTITTFAGVPKSTCPFTMYIVADPAAVSIYTTTPNNGTCSYIDQDQVLQPLTCFNSARYKHD